MTERPTSPVKPFDLFGTLKENKRRLLSLAALFLVISSPFVYLAFDRNYVARGVVRISPTRQVFLSRTDDGAMGTDFFSYIQTQVARLQTPGLIADAIKQLPEELRMRFMGEGMSALDAAEIVAHALKVEQLSSTHLITLAFTGRDKEATTELVNQIMTVYLRQLDEEEQGKDNRRLSYLEKEKAQLVAELNNANDQLRRIAVKGGSSQLDAEANIYQYKWDALRRALIEGEQHSLVAHSGYEGAMKRAAALRQVVLKPVVQERTETNPLLGGARTYAFTRLRELREQSQRLAQQSPDQKLIDLRTQDIHALVAQAEQDATKAASDVIEGRREVELQQQIIEAQYQYETAKSVVDDLNAQIVSLEGEMTERFEAFDKARTIRADITSKRLLLDEMDGRIYKLKVEAQSPGRVDIEGRARARITTNITRLAFVWLLASFGLAATIVALRSRMNLSITDRKDVELAVGAPPSWPIPTYMVPGKPDLPFARMSIDDPASPAAVAVRSLALKLAKERTDTGARLICFTGVGNQVGTTSLVINTAHSLRQMLNRVLLIDMNRSAPRIASLLLSDAREWSVLGVLNGHQPLSQSVYSDPERQIDCLFMPPEVTQGQINLRTIPELLANAKRDYDIVLIDAAPLLKSELTELIINHSDVVCPVIRGHHTLFADLHATVQLLLRFKVKTIAPVLNWYQPGQRNAALKSQQEANSDLSKSGEPVLAGE